MKNHIIFTKQTNFGDVLIERTAKHFKMPSMHSHECFELYYMINGERDYFVESNFFIVKTGQFALINQGQLHKTGGKGGERCEWGESEKLAEESNQEVFGIILSSQLHFKGFEYW